MKNPSEKLSKYSISYIYKDSEGFRLSIGLLEDHLLQAKRVKKQPKLIVVLNRNDKEQFIVDISFKIRKRG